MRNNVKKDFKDYYSILGVKPDASIEQIKKIYFAKIKKYHPDRHIQNGIDKDVAHRITLGLIEAYEFLANESSRIEYDEYYSRNREKIRREEEERRIREENERHMAEERRRREEECRRVAEERRRMEERERLRKEAEERIRAAEEKRIREEEARCREREERIRAEEQRRIDEKAEIIRKKAERKRKREEDRKRRLDEFSIGLKTSFVCSLVFGLYAFILLNIFSGITFLATASISAGISIFLMVIDGLLYFKMLKAGEDIPFSLWLIGKNSDTSIFMPSTPATVFVAFFLYYPLLTGIVCLCLGCTGIGILAVIVIALIYYLAMLYYLFASFFSLVFPVRALYAKSSFGSRFG